MTNIQLPDGEYITEVETRVLRLIFEGYPASRVAPMLCMKLQTVRDIVSTVQRKLYTLNSLQTMRRLQELGLLTQITGDLRDLRFASPRVNPSQTPSA